jgi:hypothetical protein
VRVFVRFHRVASSRACVLRACGCASRLHAPSNRTAATCGIQYLGPRRASAAARAWLRFYGGTNFQDVWASADGGARPDLGVRGWSGGTLGGYSRGLAGVVQGTKGWYRGTEEYSGVIRG